MTIVIIAILCYLLASAFFLVCVMLTARGKEYGSRVTVPSKHSGALSSSATVEPRLPVVPESVATVGLAAPGFQNGSAWVDRDRGRIPGGHEAQPIKRAYKQS